MKWVTKTCTRTSCSIPCDVIITSSNDRKDIYTSIRFRRNSHLKITKNEHIIFAVEGTRLYFSEAESFRGWKLSRAKTQNPFSYFKVNSKQLPTSKIETGMYNLELDEDHMLWYIDITHKLKEELQWNGKRGYR